MRKNINTRLLAMFLAVAVTFCGGFAALATEETDIYADDAVMSAVVKTGAGGGDVNFTGEDFFDKVIGGYTLKGIVIASLPDAKAGTLLRDGRALLIGEAVTADALGSLSFSPSARSGLSAGFEFLPVFNEDDAPLRRVTASINLVGGENRAPVAEDLSVTTCKDVAIVEPFKASDPDGDPLTFKIVSKPKRGSVEACGDGTFKYTPYEKKTGKDSFTYTASDARGNESKEAKVSVVIEKSPSKVTYADMDGSGSHYASLKLAAEGLFVGEQINGVYYFNPQEPMTRGQFLSILLPALGYDASGGASLTGFADDATIPAYLKPFALTALKENIVRGYTLGDGRFALFPERRVTRAEAAVMLNAALKPENSGVMPVFADGGDIPTWSSQAVSNLDGAGLLSANPDGALNLNDNLTREQAAKIIWDAVQYKEAHTVKKGFFGKAFA